MRSLVNLKYIALDKNSLEEFPIVLCYLISLKTLNLAYNNIKYLPYQIKEMTKLRNLTLFRNSISSIDGSLCNLKLYSLNLKKNPITRNDLPINMLAKKIIIGESILEQEIEEKPIAVNDLQIRIPKKIIQLELKLNLEMNMRSEGHLEPGNLMEVSEMLFLLEENHQNKTSDSKRCNPFEKNEESLKRSKYQ